MTKIMKYLSIIIGLLLAGVLVVSFALHQPRPTGQAGPAADMLAQKMMQAMNAPAWDTTRYLSWTFLGNHHYRWDRDRDLVDVRWKNHRVLLKTTDQTGQAFTDGQALSGAARDKLLQKAWSFFANDSFWLMAPLKAFDDGTTREIVPLKDGGQGLLVSYSSGGVTPGDAYLWHLADDGTPQKWQLWVNVLPIGGLATNWTDWTTLSTGAVVAQSHLMGPFNVSTRPVKGLTVAPDAF